LKDVLAEKFGEFFFTDSSGLPVQESPLSSCYNFCSRSVVLINLCPLLLLVEHLPNTLW
jgi:hypothetical protein